MGHSFLEEPSMVSLSPQERLHALEDKLAAAISHTKPGAAGAGYLRNEFFEWTRAGIGLGYARTGQLTGVAPMILGGRINKVEGALKENSDAHISALAKAGLSRSIIELLQSWMEVTVETRVLQRQLEIEAVLEEVTHKISKQVAEEAQMADSERWVSATEMGKALGGISDEAVRNRERNGELFSILRSGRKRGREYPTFQSWRGIVGRPLTTTLKALDTQDGAHAYSFFTSPTDLLGGLTPIEVMVGRAPRSGNIEDEAWLVLEAGAEARVETVIRAAQTYSMLSRS